jgi:hypothetical protein
MENLKLQLKIFIRNIPLARFNLQYDTETQFWAGNEFLFFENKDIRAANNAAIIDANTAVYGPSFTHNARATSPFTQDVNGNFCKNIRER